MRKLRPRITYANVIASLALFLALGGVAFAATSLPRNSVGTNQLRQGAVTTAKLGAEAVRAGKIAQGAVVSDRLAEGAVGPTNLAGEAVVNASIARGAITADKLADGSVTAAKLAADVPALPTALRSGETERGQIDVGGDGTFFRQGISYPVELPFLPEGQILGVGESSAWCPGRTFKNHGQQTPEAAPGHLCVYVALAQGEDPALSLEASSNSALGASVIANFSAPSTANRVLAFWAVTAP